MGMRVIILTGHQRSGTSVLFNSLANCREIVAINENKNSKLFDRWRLRPESETRDFLVGMGKPVLVKALNETFDDICRVFEKYDGYDLHVIFIYRDPVNVYFSNLLCHITPRMINNVSDFEVKFHTPTKWCDYWILRAMNFLKAVDSYRDHTTIVRYCDLICDRSVFSRLCDRVGIDGVYRFRGDNNPGRSYFDPRIINCIDELTSDCVALLDKNRTYCPK